MSTTGRPDESAPAASDIAARLGEAELVRLVAAATGDGVAATGLLATALEDRGVAHHTSVVALPEPAQRATDADVTLALGRPSPEADVDLGTDGRPASSSALSIASELGAVEYELALAGIVAAGATPSSDVLGAAAERGIERRPGIATPTTDLVDALAHSSLVHAPFSGDVEAAEDTLASLDSEASESRAEPLDEEVGRPLASLAALCVCADEKSAPQAAVSVERFLRPLAAPGGRFETVEGYADVLDAVARERPGLAVALALGAVEPADVLDSWRTHTRRAHEAVRTASTGRYDGLYVVRCDGDRPLGTVARLVAEYRSPEPLVLAVDDREAVAVAADGGGTGHLGSRIGEAATSVGGRGDGTATYGRAVFDCDATEFVVAFREER